MTKYLIVLCSLTLLFQYTRAQPLSCEWITQQIENDSTKSIWDYEGISPETYYCIGANIAQRDIQNHVYLIQSYGVPGDSHPCLVCRYNDFGFRINYQDDIITEELTQFIEGYNTISKGHLKSLMGDSAFASLIQLPPNNFDPDVLLAKYFKNGQIRKILSIEKLDDTNIKVKLEVDSIFQEYPDILSKVVYHVKDVMSRMDISSTINRNQIRKEGFHVTERSADTYYFQIEFDFNALTGDSRYCWCEPVNTHQYKYVVPLIVR